MTSGQDPMDPGRVGADAARAMKTAIQYQRQDTTRRFGRDVPPTPGHAHTAEARTTMHSDSDEQRGAGVYEIDADAIASAILARLLAGGTLPAAPSAAAG